MTTTTPAVTPPTSRYSAHTAIPTRAQTASKDPTNSGTARTPPPPRARLSTAGAAPGSIIAAIITTHTAAKDPNEPSLVATPMSIPRSRQTATPQHAAASPSVAARATAVAAVRVGLGREGGDLCGTGGVAGVAASTDDDALWSLMVHLGDGSWRPSLCSCCDGALLPRTPQAGARTPSLPRCASCQLWTLT